MGSESYITAILLILAGILAISGLIVSKQPSAKELIDKLVPFQGIIGVVLLGWCLISLIRGLLAGALTAMKIWPMGVAIWFFAALSGILLGFLFGMPIIAKWIPGDSPAERKALEMQQKVAAWSVIVGIAGLIAAVALILINLHIIKPGGLLG